MMNMPCHVVFPHMQPVEIFKLDRLRCLKAEAKRWRKMQKRLWDRVAQWLAAGR